ncbi:zinc-binding dehydrogenase [Streptomyces sp. NPDC004752]
MKVTAAVLTTTDAKPPYQGSAPLALEELALDPPGPGEVLVKIASAGVCHSDLSVIDGTRPRPLPMVLGHEAAGIIAGVGSGVSDVAEGDHVVFSFVPICGSCVPCQTGRPVLCERGAAANAAGTLISGRRPFRRKDGTQVQQHLGVSAFAQYTVCAQESLVRVDSTLPLEKACLFGCALLTGAGAVLNTARIEAGLPVLVVGLGGVGLAAVMAAKATGAHPIVAVDISPDKVARAASLGATHALVSSDDTVEHIRAATDGGAAYAFEAAGHPAALTTAYAATRRGGTTIAIGLPHPTSTFQLPALSLVAEERRLVGSYMGSSVPRRDIPRYIELYQAGLLPVDLLADANLPLHDINIAMDRLASGTVGRQLVLPH